MNTSMITGIALGAIAVTAGGTFAGYHLYSDGNEPAYAEVTNVVPVEKTVQTPREVCEDKTVTRQKPVKDKDQVIGTVTGAVVGGVLGNQVGGGSGKKLSTIAGAAAGGYAGNKVQERMQENNTYTTSETECRQVTDSETQVIGYRVSYRLGDEEGTVRMKQMPGDRIPVRDGELIID